MLEQQSLFLYGLLMMFDFLGETILFVDDDPDQYETFKSLEKDCNSRVIWLSRAEHINRLDGTEGTRLTQDNWKHKDTPTWNDISFAILDYHLGAGRITGEELAKQLYDEKRIPSVVLSGEGMAIRRRHEIEQHTRFVEKSAGISTLLNVCKPIFQQGLKFKEIRKARQHNIRSVDPMEQKRHKEIEDYIGPSLRPVLILGDTGVGKEEIAWEIHRASGLPTANFRTLNCAGIDDQLLRAELFGHTYNAFTGASEHRLGMILEAAGMIDTPRKDRRESDKEKTDFIAFLNSLSFMSEGFRNVWVREYSEKTRGEQVVLNNRKVSEAAKVGFTGTLFLDEVADLSPAAQGALLRFLDGYGFRPLGYTGPPLMPKVRIISATNRYGYLQKSLLPSKDKSQERPFRADLLWRINQFVVEVRSLAERDSAETINAVETRIDEFRREFRLRELEKEDSSDRHDPDIRMSPEAMDAICEFVHGELPENQEDKENSEVFRSGNFRALLAMVDRICWRIMTENPRGGMIMPQHVKDCSNIIYVLSSSTAPVDTNPGKSFEDIKCEFLSALASMGDIDVKEEPEACRKLDLSLINATSVLVGEPQFTELAIDLGKFSSKPVETMHADGILLTHSMKERWMYCLFLAALRRASSFVLKEIAKYFKFSETNTGPDRISKLMETIHEQFSLDMVGASSGKRNAKRCAEPLRLWRDPSRINDPITGEISTKEKTKWPEAQFYWMEVSEQEKSRTLQVLTYLNSLVDNDLKLKDYD